MDYQTPYQNQYSGYQAPETEMGWDDEIAASEEPQHITLPPRDYPFEVIKFERDHFNGNDNFPPCKKAVYTLRITAPDGRQTTLRHTFFVHKDRIQSITAFFVSLGMAKWGESFRPDWKGAVGARGVCKIENKEGTGRHKGNLYNNVNLFYSPEKAPQLQNQPAAYQPQQTYQPPQPPYQQPQQGGDPFGGVTFG